jgi:uncharacterized repeat protein (TIGR03803 family)
MSNVYSVETANPAGQLWKILTKLKASNGADLFTQMSSALGVDKVGYITALSKTLQLIDLVETRIRAMRESIMACTCTRYPLSGILFGAAVFCLTAAITGLAQDVPKFGVILSNTQPEGGEAGTLIQGMDGNLYVTARVGGDYAYAEDGAGTILEVTPRGKATVIHTFCTEANCTDQGRPVSLMQASNGNFYGTTGIFYGNSVNFNGTVFEQIPDGQFTTLYAFCSQANCTDGSAPFGALVEGMNRELYGVTSSGGISNQTVCRGTCGTVFEITTRGKLTTIYSFCPQTDCPEGWSPSGLVLGNDGNFYGTTLQGGANSAGTFFRITPAGALTVLYNFNGTTDGYGANLSFQGADGAFYGTAPSDVNAGPETLFRITPKGELHILLTFPDYKGAGYDPNGIIQATDGNFYGTTSEGGNGEGFGPQCPLEYGCGTLFQVTPAGQYTILVNFLGRGHSGSGSLPFAPPMQSTNGNIYGATWFGGNGDGGQCENTNPLPGCGTVFREEVGIAPFVTANPAFGELGWTINILGNELTGATRVTFNGTPAEFIVVSPTRIKATVPSGATSGTIQITTPSATLSSNVPFLVQ